MGHLSPASSSWSAAATITLDPTVIAAARRHTAGGRRYMLGIAGAPGAGKSTAAAALAAALGNGTCVVPMDGFHLANRQLAMLGRAERKGAPDTFDVEGYRALLARLRDAHASTSTIYAPDFARDVEEPIAASIAVGAGVSLVITEGNYLLLDAHGWRGVRDCLDEVWFVGLDTGEREARLIARHRRFGRSECEARDWVATTDAPNAVSIEAVAQRADRHLVWRDRHLTFAEA